MIKTVLFIAAGQGRLEDLKVLLDHLPEWEVSRFLLQSHKVTKSKYSALMMSCWNGHQEVVEYLLDKCPASIETTGSVTMYGVEIEGATPLWCATVKGHLDIVKILVKRGANINSKTKPPSTATPLANACSYGHYEIVKYLVENNADVNIKGEKHGMTPLLAASVRGHLDIVEYLISHRDLVSKQERIEALELLGATFVDKKRDLIMAYGMWKRALEERYEVPLIPKTTKKSPTAAYNNKLEVETVSELEQMSTEPDSMWMEALLVRERILGLKHPATRQNICDRGTLYSEMGNYNRCISLWMYALDIQQKYLKPLDPITHTLLGNFTELFCNMMTDEQMLEKFSDVMMVLRQAVKEVRAGQDQDVTEARIRPNIILVLLLVSRLTKLIPDIDKEQVYEIKRVVHSFVMLGAKGRDGATPLHLACSWGGLKALATVNLLLECGAPVDARDNDGNTALHTAALYKPVEDEIIKSLLQNGAHYDLVNNQKKTFYDLLQGSPLHEIPNSAVHTRLGCLAARVVRKHDLELDSLPLTLREFVLNH